MKGNLLISHNRAGKEALQHHLLECDMLFQPRLSSRVAISEYVEKLFRSAERFELWIEDDLVGLVAAYVNDPSRQNAYITSVSVLAPWQGAGLAGKLLSFCVEHITRAAFSSIRLEVAQDNISAIRLYERLRFKIIESNRSTLIMAVDLNPRLNND